MTQKPPRGARRRTLFATLAASVSLVAVAAAAGLLMQTHLTFTPSGGMVVTSNGKSGSHDISSTAEIETAARNLSFPVTLPAGLPQGSKPIRLDTSGNELMAITYDLPGAQRASHHLLYVFLADPKTIGGSALPLPKYRLQTAGAMRVFGDWRVGSETVILVSNGLTAAEASAIHAAMDSQAR